MVCHLAARPFGRDGRLFLPLLAATLSIACSTLRCAEVNAQIGQRSIPSMSYHAAFTELRDGQFGDALEDFRSEGRGAIKTPQARWIDSICYEAMVGECYYRLGALDRALEHFTASVQLYVAWSNWMIRVQFPPGIRPSGSRTPIPWGVSTRQSRLGQYPNSMLVGLGRIDNSQQVRQGGIVQQAHFQPVQVQEIVRCTTLAIRRRTKLMGPACRHDPLTQELIAALSRPTGPPNHWSEAWVDLQLGLAMVAGGKIEQALPPLQRAVLAAGEFDHPMTSIALLELGRLQLVQGHYEPAIRFFQEATYAAVHYPDAGVLEEAFCGAALAHLLSNGKGVYPPLLAAAQWAKVKDLRHLHASLLLLAAENYAVLGQTREAAGLLDEARLAIGRRQMVAGRIGGRLNFLSALVLFQQRRIADGDTALAAAMEYMRHGSYWLFHIALADGLYTSGATPRVAMDLYSDVLREPQPSDWAADPMESLSVLVTPHPGPLERWFEVALQRKEHERAVEIADTARRHRFYSSLAYGGRLQGLRWILEGPDDVLDQQSQLLRRDLLARYPAYDELAKRARQVRTALKAMPLVAADLEMFKKQTDQLEQLASISLEQEAVVREMAVRREPAALVFPPPCNMQEVQKALPDGHALLAFFATSRHLYGFLMNNEKYAYWQVGTPAALSRRIVELLREMGHFQQNHELALKDLEDNQWKQSAREILELILKGSDADFTQKLDELVIVPDGALWYLPFEALQVDVGGQLRPLISRFPLRYAPTVSLAVPTGRGRRPAGNTAVVVGRLSPRGDERAAQAAFEQLAREIPGAVALGSPPPAPSAVYAALFDRLVVLDDLNMDGPGPYGWSPLPLDRGKPGNALGDWFRLPWQGPDEVILPGFHTAAENSLRGITPTAAGSEVFLSVCGLMSSGARTLLLSRWRTGGKTSFDLVREFTRQLADTPAADAWQKSIFLVAGSPIDLEAEPRIKRAAVAQPPRAKHPFFWAGYLLVDSGAPLPTPDPAPAAPELPPAVPARPVLDHADPLGPDGGQPGPPPPEDH
ncbi:MAG: CHAT domain-containing protein [Pirellulales bacterium]|nr:CHAT domain-containing protein [Pirellulales bacterium]